MFERLKEICDAALEINKTAKEYTAIFVDGRGSSNPENMIYFIFKDGDGQKELYSLTRNDYLLCKNNGILEQNSYKGFHRRAIYKFNINKIQELFNNL